MILATENFTSYFKKNEKKGFPVIMGKIFIAYVYFHPLTIFWAVEATKKKTINGWYKLSEYLI